ncbi:MAG: DUF6056 family protein [Anaerolineales bacterium]
MSLLPKAKFVPQSETTFKDKPADYAGWGSKLSSVLYLVLASSAALPLIVYAYLGTFSRYRGDDYCETLRLMTSGNFLQASVTRYFQRSGRYSTLFFVQLSEWFGDFGMVYLAAAVLLIWLIGLTWLMAELGKVSGLRWKIGLSCGLAALAIFLSLYRAPNPYQILFWRSGMVSYLAPLALLTYVAAFILHQVQVPLSRSRKLWSCLLIFMGVFIAGGTSETIAALQIIILLLTLLGLYLWRANLRQETLLLLGTALGSALLSMLLMLISPGNFARMDVSTPPMPDWFSLGIETFTYAIQSIVDSFRVSPLPSILAFFMPFLLFYGLQNPFLQASPDLAKKLRWLLFLIPLGLLVVTAINFAPSAYAQAYPSARVRFPSFVILTLALMAAGALAGYLLSQAKLPDSLLFRSLVLGVLILTFLYPVWAATKLYDRAPRYRAEATAWDARDKFIRQAVTEGATDLVVTQLDTVAGVQEYKGDETFWVNSCAARYYGLHSLRAP